MIYSLTSVCLTVSTVSVAYQPEPRRTIYKAMKQNRDDDWVNNMSFYLVCHLDYHYTL